MENTLKPDRKYYAKCTWVTLTVSAVLAVLTAITHIIIHITGPVSDAPRVLWIITGIILAFVWFFIYPLVRVWVKNLCYIVYGDRITVHKGILTKRQHNIPFRAITDFVLRRTVYDRALGIGSIQIQTAGQSQSASGYEGSLSGLLQYEMLQEELRNKIKDLSPLSESLTTAEPQAKSSDVILAQILEEVRSIKDRLEK